MIQQNSVFRYCDPLVDHEIKLLGCNIMYFTKVKLNFLKIRGYPTKGMFCKT